MPLFAAAHPLVHVNASLNGLATVLLIVGFVLIKQRRERAHKVAMGSAFVASCAFLACYLYYHLVIQLQTPFTHEGPIRTVYFVLLASHVILAMAVPPLAIAAIVLGIWGMGDWLPAGVRNGTESARGEFVRRSRQRHRGVVRWAFPVWLYVSVTGVIVYAMLYHLWPSAALAG